MAIAYKDSTRNYALDQLYDNKFPAGALLQIRSGSPAGPNNAAGGTLGAEITLPATPWAAASAGSKAKNGTWQDASANATITAGHYRLRDSGDAEREEGTVTATGGGGDMTLDNTSIAAAQVVTINTFTRALP